MAFDRRPARTRGVPMLAPASTQPLRRNPEARSNHLSAVNAAF
jgi:hypothetical protein